MATKHGNKAYYQLLLPPHQAKLYERLADRAGVRPTAYMRDVLLDTLEDLVEIGVLAEAELADAKVNDAEVWKESVRNRVSGRRRSRRALAGELSAL